MAFIVDIALFAAVTLLLIVEIALFAAVILLLIVEIRFAWVAAFEVRVEIALFAATIFALIVEIALFADVMLALIFVIVELVGRYAATLALLYVEPLPLITLPPTSNEPFATCIAVPPI